ncbi:hypothetical protein [Halocatena marina]|uniref:hypothetical protein n=1 Tax=Halocatena marina TaxID=2934937 RepID=UPI002010A282|nr:hypothetical protein [Halocatena marina]
MTTIAVLCDPPRDGLVLTALPETSPLSTTEATELYTAMLQDACRAVEASGGELLVNYRPDDALPEHDGQTKTVESELESEPKSESKDEAEAHVRAVVDNTLDDPDVARFERQVGETFSGRAGNTATHLLEREGVGTVAIVKPNAPFLSRQQIDTAAMKLRRSPVILGPSTDGRVYYAGFRETIDYADAYTAPAVETLTDRAIDAGHEVDFLPQFPVVESGTDLAEALALIRARRRAGRLVPEHTTAFLDSLGLSIVECEHGLDLTR